MEFIAKILFTISIITLVLVVLNYLLDITFRYKTRKLKKRLSELEEMKKVLEGGEYIKKVTLSCTKPGDYCDRVKQLNNVRMWLYRYVKQNREIIEKDKGIELYFTLLERMFEKPIYQYLGKEEKKEYDMYTGDFS